MFLGNKFAVILVFFVGGISFITLNSFAAKSISEIRRYKKEYELKTLELNNQNDAEIRGEDACETI